MEADQDPLYRKRIFAYVKRVSPVSTMRGKADWSNGGRGVASWPFDNLLFPWFVEEKE